MGRKPEGERVYGPYKHNLKWRIIVRDGGHRITRDFASEEEAIEFRSALEAQVATRTVRDAIDAYVHEKKESGVRETTLATIAHRLRSFVADHAPTRLAALSKPIVATLGDRYKTRAAETQRMTFAELKRFGAWAVSKGWMASNPFATLRHAGRIKRGKPQLTIDESRLFARHCFARAHDGDAAAIAALIALLMGLRATEIIERIGRDIDDNGRVLWITRAKTDAGKRRLTIPEALQPLIGTLVTTPDAPLWQGATRYWLAYHVTRLCVEAGVRKVPPHGLRGTHATLASQAGVSPEVVAQSLGHTSFAVTKAHYSDAGVLADLRSTAVKQSLGSVTVGGKRHSPRNLVIPISVEESIN